MKMTLYLFIICILFQSGFCSKKCDTYTEVPIRGPIEEYFGVYKSGNWWLYANKTGTKKDSIYISNFSNDKLNNKDGCYNYEERRFAIKNSFLMNSNNLYVTYTSDAITIDINFSLDSGITQSAPFPFFRYDEDFKKLYSFPSFDNPEQNILDSVNLNNFTYYNILQGKYDNNVYFFSKNRGLVGWTVNGETFNLTNFKIQ